VIAFLHFAKAKQELSRGFLGWDTRGYEGLLLYIARNMSMRRQAGLEVKMEAAALFVER